MQRMVAAGLLGALTLAAAPARGFTLGETATATAIHGDLSGTATQSGSAALHSVKHKLDSIGPKKAPGDAATRTSTREHKGSSKGSWASGRDGGKGGGKGGWVSGQTASTGKCHRR